MSKDDDKAAVPVLKQNVASVVQPTKNGKQATATDFCWFSISPSFRVEEVPDAYRQTHGRVRSVEP